MLLPSAQLTLERLLFRPCQTVWCNKVSRSAATLSHLRMYLSTPRLCIIPNIHWRPVSLSRAACVLLCCWIIGLGKWSLSVFGYENNTLSRSIIYKSSKSLWVSFSGVFLHPDYSWQFSMFPQNFTGLFSGFRHLNFMSLRTNCLFDQVEGFAFPLS